MMFKALSLVFVLALAVNAVPQQQQSRYRKLSAYQQQPQEILLKPELIKETNSYNKQPQQPMVVQQYQQQPQPLPLPEFPRETSSYNNKQTIPTGSGYQSSYSAPTKTIIAAPAPYQSYQQGPAPMKVITTQTYGSYGSGVGAVTPLANSPCIGHEAGDKLAHPTSTRLFIICLEEGQYTVMPCAPSTWFNINTLKCENTLKVPKGCASSPCLNGGKCIDLPLFKFHCECLPGSAGDFCDKTDACLGSVNPCGVENLCVPLPFGSSVAKYCLCEDGNKIGLDCVSNVEKNPCLDNQLDIWNINTKINVKSAYIHCEGHIPFFKLCPALLELNVEKQQCDWPVEFGVQGMQEQQFGGYGGYGQQQQVFLKPQTTQQAYGGYGQQVIEKPKLTQEYGGYGQQIIAKPQLTQQAYGGYGQQQLKPTLIQSGYGQQNTQFQPMIQAPKQAYGNFHPPTETKY